MVQGSAQARLSDQKFGLVFATALGVLAAVLWALFGISPIGLVLTAAAFAVLALAAPAVLLPVNRAWMAFAGILGSLNNRLLLGLIYLVAIVPLGLWMSLIKRNPLAIGFEPNEKTYLVPVGRQTDAETMRDIF